MNEDLSNIYLYLFRANWLVSWAVIVSFWFGYLNFYPLDLLMKFLNPTFNPSENTVIFPFLYKLLDWTISTMLYIFPFLVVGAGLNELSQRYKFNSWDAMKKAKEIKYQATFKDCGKVIDIDLDEGGFLTSRRVTIKTESKIYRCLGSVSEVKIGSKVRRQFGNLLVIDNEKEKRLPLV